ncbi:unnamed protein product [Ceutorhynchus assimilis]|uniref:Uncharacterized protein n=1 Tax=Ceutorhynchus assimilis TaxID=467358 RepID=A0A9N9MSY3_9CUCU|nr:unnamed protein product [Ceutorhynchus assimilis]
MSDSENEYKSNDKILKACIVRRGTLKELQERVDALIPICQEFDKIQDRIIECDKKVDLSEQEDERANFESRYFDLMARSKAILQEFYRAQNQKDAAAAAAANVATVAAAQMCENFPKSEEEATETGNTRPHLEKTTCEQGTQTGEFTLQGSDTYQKWEIVEKESWPEHTFQNTEVIIGNPLNTDLGTIKVVLTEKEDPNMERACMALYKSRFPGIENFTEEYEELEQTTKAKINGEMSTTTQKVIKINTGINGEDLWKMLSRLKKSRHASDGDKPHREYDTKTASKDRRNEEEHYTLTPGIKRPERQTYALIVEEKGRDMKDLMRDVKDKITQLEGKDKILGLRNTK